MRAPFPLSKEGVEAFFAPLDGQFGRLYTAIRVSQVVRFLQIRADLAVQIIVNGEPRDLHDAATVADLLQELNLESRYLAVERNLQLVPRAEHGDCVLNDGDRLEIVTLVGGG